MPWFDFKEQLPDNITVAQAFGGRTIHLELHRFVETEVQVAVLSSAGW